MANEQPSPKDNNPATIDPRNQIRVDVAPLTGCTPKYGAASFSTGWLDSRESIGVPLSLSECVFRFTAVGRDANQKGCTYRARVGWGQGLSATDPALWTNDSILSSQRTGNPLPSRLEVRFVRSGGCRVINQVHFAINAADVVESPTWAGIGADMIKRAQRAAALSEYTVRIAPDYAAGAVPAGCNAPASTVKVRGDGTRASLNVPIIASTCKLRATIDGVPAGFEAVGTGMPFSAGGLNLLVDMSSQVRLSPRRIAIVQAVQGSGDKGTFAYSISRSCSGTNVPYVPPSSTAAPASHTTLLDGRFTVHAPGTRVFGPVAVYPLAASSATAATVGDCSVIVTLTTLPATCGAIGPRTKTLTWTAANPLAFFDFEFGVGCGEFAPTGSTGIGEPTVEPPPAVVGASPVVRISARRVADGRVEFALAQQGSGGSDNTWGELRQPARRFFPTGARVDRWLQSSPIVIQVAVPNSTPAEVVVRIVARLRASGRIEFGLQQRHGDLIWGDRLLPTNRFFSRDAPLDRWINSSALRVAAG